MKSGKSLSAPLVLAVSAALAVSLAACSGNSATSSAHTATKPKPTPAAQPTTGAAAESVVKSTWIEFFNGAVPIPKRLKLLQNGQEFASFVRSQQKTSLGSLVFQASATVSGVKLQSALGQATVTYTILLGGKPLEKNLQGTAIYSKGQWQVADGTFCSLLRLVFKPKQIPSACGA
jgi:hypothetical protein